MRGADISLSAAASGFVVLLLTVPVVQSQDGWGVTYTQTQICALKGSTVEINCTYIYPPSLNNHDTKVNRSFWFRKEGKNVYVDLKTDPEYSSRVEYICQSNRCTLRIKDLRESDSAEYKFRFITNQPGGTYTGLPGVTLTVTDLQVQVSRSKFSTLAELKCQSSCHLPGHPSYIWYNGLTLSRETPTYSGPFDPAGSYSCAVKGHEDSRSPSVYAPKLPSVSVSPSAEIVEGSSVTLTCSSDANPAAKYTWYKRTKNPDHEDLSKERQLVFSSIQPSDSGEYYCAAKNELGRRTSENIFIKVKYAPKFSSASVSPSPEIVEGSSVTLTCSSDANPAAKYTWYKENQTLHQGPTGIYNFTSISSKDTGIYYCKSENPYGQINSSSLSIDVQYAPKLPSVSVSPSTEIVEGSSVTLTCSSDANPAAKYTWYKENQTLIQKHKGSYYFTSISSKDRGIYYCKSENQYGQINSSSISLNQL